MASAWESAHGCHGLWERMRNILAPTPREAAPHREASTSEHAHSVEPWRDDHISQATDGGVDEVFDPARRKAEFACQFPAGPRPQLPDTSRHQHGELAAAKDGSSALTDCRETGDC